jgi:hypothetical protein
MECAAQARENGLCGLLLEEFELEPMLLWLLLLFEEEELLWLLLLLLLIIDSSSTLCTAFIAQAR